MFAYIKVVWRKVERKHKWKKSEWINKRNITWNITRKSKKLKKIKKKFKIKKRYLLVNGVIYFGKSVNLGRKKYQMHTSKYFDLYLMLGKMYNFWKFFQVKTEEICTSCPTLDLYFLYLFFNFVVGWWINQRDLIAMNSQN